MNDRLPRRFDRLIERVMERDREYFTRHPKARSYIRPYVPGECWPAQINADKVRVTRIADGLRIREPLTASGEPVRASDAVFPFDDAEEGR